MDRRPSRATYQRRRAIAALVLLLVVLVPVVLLSGGGGGAKQAAARTTTTAAAAGPAKPAARTDVAAVAARAHVPILTYHQIRALSSSDSATDREYIVPPGTLDKQLGAVVKAGFHAVTADQVADHMARGTKLPAKPILLTFDDASEGQYSRALPVLRKYHLHATFYVMTVVLGKPGWLTKSQVRALDRDGMEIGAHTWDHHPVPNYTGDDWRIQITQPKAELEQIVGHKIDTFAYPYGLWNAAAFPHLKDAGFRVAFQLAEKLDKQAPMYTARRILVGPDVTPSGVLQMIRADF